MKSWKLIIYIMGSGIGVFYSGWWLTRKSKVAGWAMPLFKAGHIGIFHGQAEVCHPRIDRGGWF